ncbi:MAG: substrate-binding domain-containing protein [Anaerolineae bacterium]
MNVLKLVFILLLLASCGHPSQQLVLATTTSTYDSGLLDAILPDFEARYNARVKVIAVGTGQALAIGAKGDADVVLIHARAKENEFVAEGHGVNRRDVMYNDFIVVGPPDDPAEIKGMKRAAEAFAKIAAAKAPFASRGDGSGTEIKEKAIWKKTGVEPKGDWYFSLGQGMGSTLAFVNEKRAYTLTDRGTYLSMRAKLPNLALMVGGGSIAENEDQMLFNPYGIIAVNPARHPGVNYELAMKFIQWLTSTRTQKKIGQFGVEKFGQSLFHPK